MPDIMWLLCAANTTVLSVVFVKFLSVSTAIQLTLDEYVWE